MTPVLTALKLRCRGLNRHRRNGGVFLVLSQRSNRRRADAANNVSGSKHSYLWKRGVTALIALVGEALRAAVPSDVGPRTVPFDFSLYSNVRYVDVQRGDDVT